MDKSLGIKQRTASLITLLTVGIIFSLFGANKGFAEDPAQYTDISSSDSALHPSATEGSGNTYSISQFLSSLKDEKHITIGIPETPSTEEVQSVIWIYSFLRKELGQGGVIKVKEFSDPESWISNLSENHSIIVGKRNGESKEPSPSNLKLIERRTSLSDGKESIKRILYITGEDDAQITRGTQGFLEERIRDSSFGNDLLIKEINAGKKIVSNERERVSLRDLGFNSFKADEKGQNQNEISFDLGLYSKLPKDLTFTVFGEHTPVNQQESRAFLNIYLNGFLVKSHKLGNGEIDGLNVSLPSYILRKENVLKTEFSYISSDESCEDVPNVFTGSIHDTSYLEAGAEGKVETIFEHLPWFLSRTDFQIYFRSSPTVQDVSITAELLYLFWKSQGGQEFYPEVSIQISPPQDKDLITILSPTDLKEFRLFPPLFPHRTLRIRDYRSEETVWEVKDEVSIGIVEVFKDGGRNILLGTYMGKKGKEKLLLFLNSLGKKNGFASLKGDVTLGDGNGNFYTFEKKEVKIEYPGQESPKAFGRAHKLAAFIFVWILLLSFSFYLYYRSNEGVKRNAREVSIELEKEVRESGI